MNAPSRRRIAHIDMDAFYASVELLRFPRLRGRPLVIGGRAAAAGAAAACQFPRLRDYTGRGVVTTSTYEARALGVHSGMGLMKAAKLAPDAVLLPADFDAYRHHSRLFKAAVAGIAPQIEDRGIDEIYVDLSDLREDTLPLIGRIKQAVYEATGLTCSVGVSPNKLLSKIGSELDKPDGITVLDAGELATRIWPLPASRINGIGPKATARLEALGVHTIGELAHADAAGLQRHFGHGYAAWLQQVAHGIDERPVITQPQRKSVSRETTFERDLHPRRDREALSTIFTGLCERVADDLRRAGCVTGTVGIKLRYDDFRTVTRDVALPFPTADARLLRQAATRCLRRAPLDRRLRLLGVRAAALTPVAEAVATSRAEQRELPLVG